MRLVAIMPDGDTLRAESEAALYRIPGALAHVWMGLEGDVPSDLQRRVVERLAADRQRQPVGELQLGELDRATLVALVVRELEADSPRAEVWQHVVDELARRRGRG